MQSLMMVTSKQRGFSLIELIFFIVVVALGLAGILSVMNSTVASSVDPLVRKQALVLADALMEEIMLKASRNPEGGYSGNNRCLFDDVGDYQGYSTCCGMVMMDGSPMQGLERYNIMSVTINDIEPVAGAATLKQVVVTVSGPQGELTLRSLRGGD
jgi:MSHA pilin protein MshD